MRDIKNPVGAAVKEFTTAPITAIPIPGIHQPEFIRLAKPGSVCPLSGLSRSVMNRLILPREDNGFKPPVKSVVLRQKGAKRGVRLINYQSLINYLRSLPAPSDTETNAA